MSPKRLILTAEVALSVIVRLTLRVFVYIAPLLIVNEATTGLAARTIELLSVVMFPAESLKAQFTTLLVSPAVKVRVTVEATACHAFGVTNSLVVISPPIFILTAPETSSATPILMVVL